MNVYDKTIEDAKKIAGAETGNELTVGRLAREVGYSAKQLTRIFVMKEGMRPESICACGAWRRRFMN